MGHRKESTQCYSKTPQSGNTVLKSIIMMMIITIIIKIIMIIAYCNYKFNDTFGPKMSAPPGVQMTAVRTTQGPHYELLKTHQHTKARQ